MKELNLQSVILIDDHCKNYLSALQPAAEVAGFEIIAFDNVLDGINYLSEYKDTIHAVILDIKFPKGEIQGMEGLQKIKKIQPDLPVLMLTDSDSSSDIDIVVECMKNGAYNYIGKRTLNPVYLFQLVERAVNEYKLHERIKSRIPITEKTNLFFTIKQDYDFGRYKKSGIFGFKLIYINKPENERDAVNLEKNAFQWHENLLKTLSVIYCDDIHVNLKYIKDNTRIQCFFIFTAFAINEIWLEATLNSLQHNINLFFFPSKTDKLYPYIFDEIMDAKYLQKANKLSVDLKYHLFYRQPIKVKSKKNIGFSVSGKDDNPINKPVEIFSNPKKFQNDINLFNTLYSQEENIEIDVKLIPKQILPQEIELIKGVINEPQLLNTENLTDEEKNQFAEYLQKFIVNSKDKFLIRLILKKKSINGLHNLKMNINNYFFGLKEKVVAPLCKYDELTHYTTSKAFQNNQLPFLYSVEEAVQIFRLPIPCMNNIPGINQQSHNYHFEPDNLVEEGVQIGIKKTINGEKKIFIDKESLARHLYIMGQTGTGKSTMLKTMINDCINNNMGFTVIDPHGDLFDQVIKLIPKRKKNKVYIIDTTDSANTLKFNPLHYDINIPQAKSLVVNDILSAVDSLYDLKLTGGPMFELYFKNGLFLLLDEAVAKNFGNATLANLINVFLDDNFRDERLDVCENIQVKQFFRNAVNTSGESSFTNLSNYITSKLTRFVEDFYLAPILNSEFNSIDFRKIIDDGNIFLVKMDKGLIGSMNTSLLGQIILNKIFSAGMSRTTINKDQRKPHYIFIDEFQNFVKSDIGIALSEVRKYGLTLILANQTLGQLNDHLVQSLLGNVGSLVFFRPGITDYEKLKYYIEPEFKREDVLKLPNFNCISRIMIDNIPSDPFVFQTKNI